MADNSNGTGSTTGRSGYTAEEIREMYEFETAPADTAESLARDGLDVRAEAPPLEGGRMPATRGNWEAEVSVDASRGNTGWYSDRPEVNSITGGEPVQYEAGYPDFSPYTQAQVEIEMTGNNNIDFTAANEAFAVQQEAAGQPGNWLNGDFSPNANAAQEWMDANNLSWHHHQDLQTMQAVPEELHGNMPHTGGASGARALAEAPPEAVPVSVEAAVEPLAAPVAEAASPALAPAAAPVAEALPAVAEAAPLVEGSTLAGAAEVGAATFEVPIVAVGAVALYLAEPYLEKGAEEAAAYVEPRMETAFAETKAVVEPAISNAVTEVETTVGNVTSGIANSIDHYLEPPIPEPAQVPEVAHLSEPVHAQEPAPIPESVYHEPPIPAPEPVHHEPPIPEPVHHDPPPVMSAPEPSHSHVDAAPSHSAPSHSAPDHAAPAHDSAF